MRHRDLIGESCCSAASAHPSPLCDVCAATSSGSGELRTATSVTISIGLIQTLVGAALGLFAGFPVAFLGRKLTKLQRQARTAVFLGAEDDQKVLQEIDFVIAARPRGKFQPQAAWALGIAQLSEQPDANRKTVTCTSGSETDGYPDTPRSRSPQLSVPGPPDLFTAAVCAFQARYVH